MSGSNNKYILPKIIKIEDPVLFPFSYFDCEVLFLGENNVFKSRMNKGVIEIVNGQEVYISNDYHWFIERMNEPLELFEVEGEKYYVLLPKTEEGHRFLLNSILSGMNIKVCGTVVKKEV